MLKKPTNFFVETSIYASLALGVCLRILTATRGHNYDFESYLIVIRIVETGGNVYAETSRYNYGPIWFNILHFLYTVSTKNPSIFRYTLVAFLGMVDAGIFLILLKRYSVNVATIFFLNPVTIIITGFHNQFDNLAILFSLAAVCLIGDRTKEKLNARQFIGLILLGFSITTKHLFFAFPFWLAIRRESFRERALVLLIPVSVFILSFLPYWNKGKEGIINNVFLYSSYKNEIFYNLLTPNFLHKYISSMLVWLLVIMIGAFIYKRDSITNALLYYAGVLVGTSPAISNQYLAIPIPYLSVKVNVLSIIYIGVATIHLFTDYDGLHFLASGGLEIYGRNFYYSTLVILVISHLTWQKIRQPVQQIILQKFNKRNIK